MRKAINKKCGKFNYKFFYPKNYNKKQQYAVVFFTHGHGGVNKSFDSFLEDTNFIKLLNLGYSSLDNCIVVCPHCTTDTYFDNFTDLIKLANRIYNRKDVDKSNFNGLGISMGGYTIYQLMMSTNSLWHRALILCAGGLYWNAVKIKDIPLKIIHGTNDQTIYIEEAIRMKEKLDSYNSHVELIKLDGFGHNIWDETWTHEEYFDWLIS